MSDQIQSRVDEDGNVFVVDVNGERLIGQYPDVTPEEAIAFFERKFNDTNSSLVIIEQRLKRKASTKELTESLKKVQKAVEEKTGIGNYEALQVRIDAIHQEIKLLAETESAEKTLAVEKARADREHIVTEIEKLAAQDPAKIQWKKTTADVDALFASWQNLQKTGPRLPKTEADELWKRFRTARQTLDKLRRNFFASLDSQSKEAKSVKEQLISQAEKLDATSSSSVAAYRELLEKWKKAPRAGKKTDDALWDRFKACGDKLYQAKKEADTAEDESYAGNLDVKLGILAEAEKLTSSEDPVSARAELNNLQKKWEKAGKVPRAHFKSTEDRMKKVELAVKKLEEKHWQDSNPEKIARSEGLAGQIEEKIDKLTVDLLIAKKENNVSQIAEIESAISTQKEWLDVLK
jgi:hypothetical protein